MMHYPKELFDLNFAFVYKASEILERPWPDLLLEYTHTFRRFRLGAQLDPHNPIWLQYLDSVSQSHDPAGYSYHFYLERERVMGPKKLEPAFGCFSYQLQPQEGGLILRIHFANPGLESGGPLRRERQPARLAELNEMFSHAQQQLTQQQRQLSCHVLGASWLYNLPAYQRLFPPTFTANLTPQPPDFPMIALWGQFLDHRLQIRPDLAQAFLTCIHQARTLEDLRKAFPYSILTARAALQVFLTFYGIEQPAQA